MKTQQQNSVRILKLSLAATLVAFATGCGSDNPDTGSLITPPTVLQPALASTNPVAGQFEVPTNADLVVTFTDDMHSPSVDGDQFQLFDRYGELVPAEVNFVGRAASLTPDSDLHTSSNYTIRLGSGIVDVNGEPIVPYSWDFYTDGNGWTTAERFRFSEDVDDIQMATDGNGNAFAIWSEYVGDSDGIFASRFTPETGWSAPMSVDDSHEDAYIPQIAMSSDGSVIAVWLQEHVSDPDSIWTAFYTVDGGWGVPEKISTEGEIADYPDVAMDGEGHAIAVWVEDDTYSYSPGYSSSGDDAYAKKYTPGIGWGSRQFISSGGGTSIEDAPQIAMGEDGSATVIWTEYNPNWGNNPAYNPNNGSNTPPYNSVQYITNSDYDITVARFSDDSWNSTEDLSINNIDVKQAQVAADDSGNAAVTWMVETSSGVGLTEWDVESSIYDFDDDFWDDEIIDTNVNSGSMQQVDIGNDGNFAVVWEDRDEINVAVGSIEDGFQGDSTVSDENVGQARSPDVSMDDEGNIVVVWVQEGTYFDEIWTSNFDIDIGPGAPELIDNSLYSDVDIPSYVMVELDDNGDAIAVWGTEDDDTGETYISASHYDPRSFAP